MAATARKRGRPPLTWISRTQLAQLPSGTAVALDLGDRKALTRGRIDGFVDGEVALTDGRTVVLAKVMKARVLRGLYDAGDLVVRRGVPESEWRGGVVRSNGFNVLVESADGFAWLDENAIETAEERDQANARLSTRVREKDDLSEMSE